MSRTFSKEVGIVFFFSESRYLYYLPPTGRYARYAFPDGPIDARIDVRFFPQHEKVEHEAERRAGEDGLGEQWAQFDVPRVSVPLVGVRALSSGWPAARRALREGRPETEDTASVSPSAGPAEQSAGSAEQSAAPPRCTDAEV